MADRFHFDGPLTRGAEIALDEAEGRHLAQVLRGKPGDAVVVFDGAGVEAEARVRAVSKRGVTLTIEAVRRTDDAPGPRLVLATAVPKGERFKWLVEKATELGVERLVPLSTARSVVDPREAKLDRMRAAVIAACKQCGRNRLMDISPPMSWSVFLSQVLLGPGGPNDRGEVARETPPGSLPEQRSSPFDRLLLTDPRGRPVHDALASLPSSMTLAALVGPEGGLTDDEIEQATAAGAIPVCLGPHILRVETAGLAIAGSLAARFHAR